MNTFRKLYATVLVQKEGGDTSSIQHLGKQLAKTQGAGDTTS